MHSVDEQPETIHLYVVREKEPRPSFFPIFLSVVALSLLIMISVLFPYQQPVTRITIRVPAVLSYVRSYSASITVTPTGIKTYPATFAHGVLTITNGSVVSQELPAGIIFASGQGIEVATDRSVFVPAGSADGFGVATVSAHVLTAGLDLPALAINQVIGTSLFIRNLEPFTGGYPAYSVKYITDQDRLQAIVTARSAVAGQVSGLHYPCKEVYLSAPKQITMMWRCQFITYSVPSYMRVTSVQIQGKEVLLAVWFVARPRRIWVK